MILYHAITTKQRILLCLIALLCIIGIFFSTQVLFRHAARRQLAGSVSARILEFKSELNKEIVLALQMGYSPVIVDYLSHPEDEQKQQLAFAEFKSFQDHFLSHTTFWISDKDLRYHANGEYLYTLDKSLKNSYWYDRTFGKDLYLFNINYDPGLQNIYLWIDIPVYDNQKQRAGVTGTGIPITNFVSQVYRRLKKNETMYFYNDMLEVTGSPKVYHLQAKLNITSVVPELKKIQQEQLMSKSTFYFSTYKGEYVIAPIEELNWYMVLYIPYNLKAFFVNLPIPLVGILVMVIFFLISQQNRIYHSENTIIRNQKKEIETLNANQSRFFASMSHEIRTPINTIIGLDEMILREAISDEVAEDARNIAGASKMLLSLINDILDMSKIDSGKMEIVSAPYETKTMLYELINMVWIRAKEKALTLQVHIDPSLPTVLRGDEVRIKQILLNILNNAIKYTREGSVTFSVQSERRSDDQIRLVCSVEDTGIGIKKENIPFLFDAFKRVDNQKNHFIEGTGLGLSIVKQLVTLMGGTVSVDSIYTKGSTFTITLDQGVVDATEVGELELVVGRDMSEKNTYKKLFEAPQAQILIVDDNTMNLMVASKLLRDTKMHVDTATSGELALSMTLNKRYNVILMDHLMPEMDGITCLHEIRKQISGMNHDTPVVALTANAGEKNRIMYEREGFDGYLAKPVSGAQLEQTILSLLPSDIVQLSKSVDTEKLFFADDYNKVKKIPIIISTDSVCDLPQELIKKEEIPINPYKVRTNDGIFLDGVEIEANGMLSYIEHNGMCAYSEAPSVQDYERFFAQLLQKAQSVVHITMSRKVSAGYAHAMEAAKSFDNIKVVDSEQVSSSTGLAVLYALNWAREQPDAAFVAKRVNENKRLFSTMFLVDSLSYLDLTGRMSHFVYKLCHSLLMTPVVMIKNGKIGIKRVFFGPQEYVRTRYINSLLSKASTIDDSILFITHVGLREDELESIKQQVLKRCTFKKVYFQKASPAIASNSGKGAFGLLFMKKHN